MFQRNYHSGQWQAFCSVSNILVQYSDNWGQAQSMCKRWDKRRNWQISIHEWIEDNQCSRTFCALGMSKECIDRARWKKLMDFFIYFFNSNYCSVQELWGLQRCTFLIGITSTWGLIALYFRTTLAVMLLGSCELQLEPFVFSLYLFTLWQIYTINSLAIRSCW